MFLYKMQEVAQFRSTTLWIKKNSTVHRAIPSKLGLLNTQRPHTDGIETDTILNDETSKIKGDLCAFGSTGGVPRLLSNSSGVHQGISQRPVCTHFD